MLQGLAEAASAVGSVRARHALGSPGRPGRVEHQARGAFVEVECARVFRPVRQRVVLTQHDRGGAVVDAVVELGLGEAPARVARRRARPTAPPSRAARSRPGCRARPPAGRRAAGRARRRSARRARAAARTCSRAAPPPRDAARRRRAARARGSLGDVHDRVHDRLVARAAAEVPAEHVDHLLPLAAPRGRADRSRRSGSRACRSRTGARVRRRKASCSGAPCEALDRADRRSRRPARRSVRHERTATPSSWTVQAPQTPCSQPTCVPVSPSSWRRKSDSSSRGSTSARRSTPLTSTSDHSACSSAARDDHRRSDAGDRRPTRAGCRAGRRARRHARRLARRRGGRRRALELELEQRGPVDDRADADPRLADDAVLDREASRRPARARSRRAARRPLRSRPSPPSGHEVETSSSSGSSSEVKCETKNSSASSTRSFDVLTEPPSTTRQSGSSALASAWAIEPPTVPRFRVA